MAEKLETLVVRAQTGDREAYGAIVQRFQEMALAWAYSIVGDYELAEDARQEAFLGAYCDLLSLREPAAFPGWFRGIVRNHSLQVIRGRRRLLLPLEEAPEPAADAPPPDRALAERETRVRIQEAVGRLPAREREVTRLFYFEERSLREISRMTGAPVQTVKSRLHMARARLRQRLMEMVKKDITQQTRRGDRRPLKGAASQAIAQFDEELKTLQPVLNEEVQGHAVDLLCAKGRLLRFLGRMDEARETFEAALAQPALQREGLLRTRLRAELGLNWVHVSDYERGRGELEAALAAARRLAPGSGLQGSILNGLGLCAWCRGELEAARGLYLEAAEAGRAAACAELEATAANNLALLDWKLGRLGEALAAFKRCLAVWKKLRNRHDTALTLMNVGIIEENLGRAALARRHYEQAQALAEEVGFAQVQAATQGNLANLALTEERWPEAWEAGQKALELARAIGDRRSQAIALENQALACLGLGRFEQARAAEDEARRLAREIGDQERLLSLELVAIERSAEGGARSAEKRVGKELTDRVGQARGEAERLGFVAELPRILRIKGLVLRRLGDLAGASEALDEALAECRRQKNKPEEQRVRALREEIGD